MTLCREKVLSAGRTWLLVAAVALGPLGAARGEDSAERRNEYLKQMNALAKATDVRLAESDDPARLVESPVFRYDDQPRRFLDATMWIWTDGVRPVACQKIEARRHFDTDKPLWGYCFTSTSAEPIAARWSGDRRWRSTEAGIEWQPVPGAGAPRATSAARRLQAREIARGFACRMLINPRTEETAAMRLLTTPIYEYADPESKLLVGAVFGFEVNGTNPDLLVLVEARGDADKPAWHFAPARMTTGGLKLKYGDKAVWECPFVEPTTGPYSNWLFFSTPREPLAGE
ncbi:MAG TPA: hypothetical protein VFV87_23245 [Pirellulaceae bacterium]|nr:hypothetical protein [Pirellulaceae bacterium]